MRSIFSHTIYGSAADKAALEGKIEAATKMSMATLRQEIEASEAAKLRVVELNNEIAAVQAALTKAQGELAVFNRLNGNVAGMKENLSSILLKKQAQELIAELHLAFAVLDETVHTSLRAEQKNFRRRWQQELTMLLDISALMLPDIKEIYVKALINVLKKPDGKKVDLTREYYFKLIMRYIARNKTTRNPSKEIMKAIRLNLGVIFLEHAQNISDFMNAKPGVEIQADAKILVESLRKLLTHADVNLVLALLNQLCEVNFYNEYQNLSDRLKQTLDNNPAFNSVFYHLTVEEQKVETEYQKQIAGIDQLVEGKQYTSALVSEFIQNLFNGVDSTLQAPYLATHELNFIKKIAKVFAQAATPVKKVGALQIIVAKATNVLQAHEYITSFVGPVAEIQAGSVEELLTVAELDLPVELQAYDPAAIVSLMKQLGTDEKKLASLNAEKLAVSARQLDMQVDNCVASALINTVYRALQLSAAAKNKEINKAILEKLDELVECHVIKPDLNAVVGFIIEIFDQLEKKWLRGYELQINSLDTCLLQLLFNTGTPKGIFNSSLVEIQAAYPGAGKDALTSKFPLSDLQGEVALWLSAPAAGKPPRLSYQHCQWVREQAKLNLLNLQFLLDSRNMNEPLVETDLQPVAAQPAP
jgi:hypothetical protein